MLVLAISAFLGAPQLAQAQDDTFEGRVISSKVTPNEWLVAFLVDKEVVIADFTNTEVYATVNGKLVRLSGADAIRVVQPGAVMKVKKKKKEPKGIIVIAIIGVLISTYPG